MRRGRTKRRFRRLIIASLAEASASVGGGGRPAGQAARAPQPGVGSRADPLLPYLDLDVVLEPDAASEVVALWLIGQITARLVDVGVDDVQGRRRALDTSAAWWAGKMSVEQHQSIEFAAAQLHLALSAPTRRAS